MMHDPIQRSAEKRESVMMRAIVWRQGARAPSEHRVRNLSPSGAMLDQADKLKRGDALILSIGLETDIRATVAWVKPGYAGVHFDEPIDTALARRRPGSSMGAQSGWIGGMDDAYRRH